MRPPTISTYTGYPLGMSDIDDLGWPGLSGEEARAARRNFERYIEIATRIVARLHKAKVDSAHAPNTMKERSNQETLV